MNKYLALVAGVLGVSVIIAAVGADAWTGEIIYNRINLNHMDAVQLNLSGTSNQTLFFTDAAMSDCTLKTVNGSVRCGTDIGAGSEVDPLWSSNLTEHEMSVAYVTNGTFQNEIGADCAANNYV